VVVVNKEIYECMKMIVDCCKKGEGKILNKVEIITGQLVANIHIDCAVILLAAQRQSTISREPFHEMRYAASSW
jgi:hypothetical protein